MSSNVIDGRKIAACLQEKTAGELRELQKKYRTSPVITTVKIGNDPSSDQYLRLREKACEEVGIISEHVEFPEDVTENRVLRSLEDLNNNPDVHGVLLQFPLPGHISSSRVLNVIDPQKDVEGLTPYNMGRTPIGEEYLIPCTPLAVLTILDQEQVRLQGKDVVIVNHSNVVGKPLAGLFLNRNASVSVCHVFTRDTRQYTSQAEVLVTAVGKPGLITSDYVKDQAVVIDVGFVKTDQGVFGDVDFHNVKKKAGKITPVPGGVGPVTIACSLMNMVKTYKNCLEEIQR
jgi:methylenetetrahydrofolate dehydrogenase (NADP+)/methenyltetrahydrofolate cyclohydrolase